MRLFVAVRPPESVRDALLDAMGGVAGARWQSDDQLHLTLRFIGEVDRHTASDIAAALAGVHHPPIAATLTGTGSFTSKGRPSALWAGVGPVAALTALHHKVDHALARAGIAPDSRAFVPHITLARGRPTGSLAAFLATRLDAAFAITQLTLFESILTRDAAAYVPLATIAFADPRRSTVVNSH